jgi:hypothetical protein
LKAFNGKRILACQVTVSCESLAGLQKEPIACADNTLRFLSGEERGLGQTSGFRFDRM